MQCNISIKTETTTKKDPKTGLTKVPMLEMCPQWPVFQEWNWTGSRDNLKDFATQECCICLYVYIVDAWNLKPYKWAQLSYAGLQ